MEEKLDGRGVLRRVEPPTAEWPVEYRFVITTSHSKRPGFAPAVSSRSSIGSVQATNGKVLLEGYYQLTTGNGEVIRVKNLGIGRWTILAPL